MGAVSAEKFIKNLFYNGLKKIIHVRKYRQKELNFTGISRILIVKHDRIGDMLLITPLFKILKQNIPGLYLAVLASNYNQQALLNNPYVDDVFVYDYKSSRRSKLQSLSLRFVRMMRKKKFDAAIISNASSSAAFIGFLSNARLKIGYQWDGEKKYLSDLFYNVEIPQEKLKCHAVEKNLKFAEYLGININYNQEYLQIFLSDEEKQFADKFYKQNNIVRSDLVIGVHPSVDKPASRWETVKFAELSDILAKKYNAKIVFVYGPNEKEIIGELAKLIKEKHVFAPDTNIRQLMALMSRFNVFIGNDTSTAHIASAFGSKIVDIFGPTDPDEYRPWCKHYRILQDKTGDVNKVEVKDVLKAVEEMLLIKDWKIKD